MNPDPITRARLDWPSAIGSFLLSFGSLEYFVSVYLEDHLDEAEFQAVKKRHLADRLERIAKSFQGEHHPQVERDRFAALMARATPLRELRNLIAHGQMHMRIAPDTGNLKVVLLNSWKVDNAVLPETNELEFIELERALTEIASVNQEFEWLAGFKTTSHAVS
jgi:hypothetical protein